MFSLECSVDGDVETEVEDEADEEGGTGVWRGVSDCEG